MTTKEQIHEEAMKQLEKAMIHLSVILDRHPSYRYSPQNARIKDLCWLLAEQCNTVIEKMPIQPTRE